MNRTLGLSLAIMLMIGSTASARVLQDFGTRTQLHDGIVALNEAPQAMTSGDQYVPSDTLVTVNSTGSADPEGLDLVYRWLLDIYPEGSSAILDNSEASSVSFTTDLPGLYLVKLVVNDGVNDSEPAYAVIRVGSDPIIGGLFRFYDTGGQAKVVTIGVYGQEDLDGSIVAYEYDYGDGTRLRLNADETDASGVSFHAYTTPGTYTVTGTVIDNHGREASATTTVNIDSNQLPIPKFTVSSVSGSANAANPFTLTIDASQSSDAEGTINRFRYNIEQINENFPSASFSKQYRSDTYSVHITTPGVYRVRVRPQDQNRARNDAYTTIYVDDLDNPGSVVTPPGGATPSAVVETSCVVGAAPLTVLFNSSNSFDVDIDGAIVDHAWDFGDYRSHDNYAKGMNVSHTFTRNGAYRVLYTATDNGGNTETKSVQVYVGDGSRQEAKIAVFKASHTNDSSVYVTAHSSIAATNPSIAGVSFNTRWDLGDGEVRAGLFSQLYDYATEGEYEITLRTVDVFGNRYTDKKLVGLLDTGTGGFPSIDLKVDGANNLQFVRPVGESFIFDGSNSSPAPGVGGGLSYNWVPGNNGFGNCGPGFGTSPADTYTYPACAYAYSQNGIFLAELFVTDLDQRSSLAAAFVSVVSSTNAPVAQFTVDTRVGVMPLTVNLDASLSFDPNLNTNDPIENYYWDFGDSWRGGDQGTATTSHTYSEAGEYVIRLIVEDASGDMMSMFKQVNVLSSDDPGNVAPSPSFTFAVGADGNISFDASASTDSDGEIEFYEWDFGDGIISSGRHAFHTYSAPDTYTVRLVVIDNDGGVSTMSQGVVIQDFQVLARNLSAVKAGLDGEFNFGSKTEIETLGDDGPGDAYWRSLLLEASYKNGIRAGCSVVNSVYSCVPDEGSFQ